MIHSLLTKDVVVIKPASVATNATSTGNVDRLGFDWVSLKVIHDSAADVTNNPATLKLSESDITDATGFADITAAVGDGVGGFTIPNVHTSLPTIVRFEVDCRNRKRYLKLSLTTAGAAAICCAVATCGRPKESPETDTARGATEVVVI